MKPKYRLENEFVPMIACVAIVVLSFTMAAFAVKYLIGWIS